MTNKEMFKLWEEFRAEQFNCYPDENGNYPCDNGELCDKCCTDEAICWFTSWKRKKIEPKKKYRVTITDTATYEFDEPMEYAKAIEVACEWFVERSPCIHVEELK